jgi:tRNA/rRNA methyltransferase
LAGTTGRFEEGSGRSASCRRFAEQVLPRLASVPVGIVFGPEDNGLRRSELRLCQYLLSIPSGSDYAVMNLSQAVAVVAYELQLALEQKGSQLPADDGVEAGQVQGLLQELEGWLDSRPLPPHLSPQRLMHRLRSLAARTPLQPEDLKMLRQLLRLRD